MRKIVAVRIEDIEGGLRVTGFLSRGKNRKRACVFDVPVSEKQTIPERLEAEQEKLNGRSEE